MNLSTSAPPPATPSTSTAPPPPPPQPEPSGPPSTPPKLHDALLAKFLAKGIPTADVTVYRDFVLQHDALLEVLELKKCNRTAVQVREAGNQLFLEKKYDEALEKYNESICYAEFNSEHLGMGYANRSAVYFDQGEYEFALYNIMLARKHNFPEELRSQLMQREMNCREKIIAGQSKIAGQVGPPSSRIGLNVEVNARLPFVAKGIAMKYYPEFGSGLVAEKDFNTGDVILDEKPMLMAVEHGLRYSVCSYCTAAFRRSLIPCPNCVSCMYCSEKCLEMDHRFTHRFECGIMERLRNASFNTSIITSRLFFYGLTLFGDNLQLMMKSCWDTFNSGGNPFDLDYTQYDPLEEFKTMHKVKFRLPKANIEHHYRMCAALHYAVFMKHPLVQSLVVGKTYQGFMLQCLLNYTRVVFFLMKDTVVDARDRVVSFLSPIATIFNHSCDPNVLIIPRASRIVSVILRPVRKGEQLTSTYGPTWWDVPNLALTFDCRCVVCVLGKKGSDWCPPGRQLAPEAIRDLKRVCDLADEVARLNAAQQFIQRYAALYPEANLGGMVKLFSMLLIYVTCCETDASDQMRVVASGII
uniref:SET domain-containing protein n=1 Tax=Culex tarsalis TaxID=7177 RepID=A0A1Q3F0H3_CULTA